MILGQQQASKIVPLIANVEAYDAFLALIETLHKQFYIELVHENSPTARGALLLLDELKDLKQRMRDIAQLK